jgi:excinuclease UvrABC ATPase subunit
MTDGEGMPTEREFLEGLTREYPDNTCPACEGTCIESTGVEYMGQREMGSCQECEGTGVRDPWKALRETQDNLAKVEELNQPLRISAQVGDQMVRELLVALCEEQNVSIQSPWYPDQAAPNFVLAERLGIGRVFGLSEEAGNAQRID